MITPVDAIPELRILEPKVFQDDRGYFYETYNKKAYGEHGISDNFVQDNQSLSKKGALRGMHYQIASNAQSKLVRVIHGAVFDVAVDMRKESASFGKWFGLVLSGENKLQFYIPRGFAHGFLTLTDTALFSYKCDNFYAKEDERGFRFDDHEIAIGWPELDTSMIVSSKDKELPSFKQAYTF